MEGLVVVVFFSVFCTCLGIKKKIERGANKKCERLVWVHDAPIDELFSGHYVKPLFFYLRTGSSFVFLFSLINLLFVFLFLSLRLIKNKNKNVSQTQASIGDIIKLFFFFFFFFFFFIILLLFLFIIIIIIMFLFIIIIVFFLFLFFKEIQTYRTSSFGSLDYYK